MLPVEIAVALKQTIKGNIGIECDEAIKEVGKLFGFRSTSAKLRDVINPVLQTVCDNEGFRVRDSRIYAD